CVASSAWLSQRCKKFVNDCGALSAVMTRSPALLSIVTSLPLITSDRAVPTASSALTTSEVGRRVWPPPPTFMLGGGGHSPAPDRDHRQSLLLVATSRQLSAAAVSTERSRIASAKVAGRIGGAHEHAERPSEARCPPDADWESGLHRLLDGVLVPQLRRWRLRAGSGNTQWRHP